MRSDTVLIVHVQCLHQCMFSCRVCAQCTWLGYVSANVGVCVRLTVCLSVVYRVHVCVVRVCVCVCVCVCARARAVYYSCS